MSKRFRSKSIIPKISLWNIADERPFNAFVFESIPPTDMIQYRAHQKKHFVISYSLKGSFKNYIDFKEKIFSPGDVGLVNPNHIHFVRPVDKKIIKIIIIDIKILKKIFWICTWFNNNYFHVKCYSI